MAATRRQLASLGTIVASAAFLLAAAIFVVFATWWLADGIRANQRAEVVFEPVVYNRNCGLVPNGANMSMQREVCLPRWTGNVLVDGTSVATDIEYQGDDLAQYGISLPSGEAIRVAARWTAGSPFAYDKDGARLWLPGFALVAGLGFLAVTALALREAVRRRTRAR